MMKAAVSGHYQETIIADKRAIQPHLGASAPRREAPAPGDLGSGREPPPDRGIPVVGLGASAGGLAAFEAFFSALPAIPAPRAAFVLVQHLAPEHESILAELVRRRTELPVLVAEDGMPVRAATVYVIPPDKELTLRDGALRLGEAVAARGFRTPIDAFFRSLAEERREGAICVVLSGNGCDGTLGLRAVKAEGGMAMVQDPESTENDGMPRSALSTGLADFVLPPAKMPSAILDYLAGRRPRPDSGAAPADSLDEATLRKTLSVLRERTGHDFSLYKPSTVGRRVLRRMAVAKAETLDGYARILDEKPEEAEALFRDLLIGVTGFFRDPEAFKELEERIIPRLFEDKEPEAAIRVWSAGCSTGEEAYSLAILLAERQATTRRRFKIQVFATDLDARAIAAARAGLFPASVAADLSPERLGRHFSPEGADKDGGPAGYRISKSIRDLIVFSEQSLVKDPPFSKIDLVSCRNLLIYLGAELQKAVIPLFHYALAPGGFLFLGTSETVGEFSRLFETVDRKSRIYRRKESLRPEGGRVAARLAAMPRLAPALRLGAEAGERSPGASYRDLLEQALLGQFDGAALLVDGSGDILYLHGRVGAYLEPSSGEALMNIVKMAKDGLAPPLAAALRKAFAGREPAAAEATLLRSEGPTDSVDIVVRPLAPDRAEGQGGAATALYLVTLRDGAARSGTSPVRESEPEALGAAMARELRLKDEYLKASMAELEAFNEELKSSNEELQSVNEEFQSTNEELETSKEELQSVNEELATVNGELQAKVGDLSRANDDMSNLLAGTGIATIFVDKQLRILRFTPAATRIVNLIAGDVGRPVSHLVANLADYDALSEDVRSVLASLVPKEVEVRTREGQWYTMRIIPYRTQADVIEGAVVNFIDITQAKLALAQVESLVREKELLLRELRHRTRNNMHAVCSLLSLQAACVGQGSAAEALVEAGRRVQGIISLHERLAESPSAGAKPVQGYLSSLIDEIVAGLAPPARLRIEKEIEDFEADEKTLSDLGLILNELLTNAVKYAFVAGQAGLIKVALSRQGGRLRLSVGDDGVGMGKAAPGECSTGFGLRLVSMLADQHGGSVEIEKGAGTRVVVELAESLGRSGAGPEPGTLAPAPGRG